MTEPKEGKGLRQGSFRFCNEWQNVKQGGQVGGLTFIQNLSLAVKASLPGDSTELPQKNRYEVCSTGSCFSGSSFPGSLIRSLETGLPLPSCNHAQILLQLKGGSSSWHTASESKVPHSVEDMEFTVAEVIHSSHDGPGHRKQPELGASF